MWPWVASHALAAVGGGLSLAFWFRLALRRPDVAVQILEGAAAVIRTAAADEGQRRWKCPGCGRIVDGRPTLPDPGEVTGSGA